MERVAPENILGFSHNGAIRQERMKAIKNYLPQPNETIGVFHEEFGYIGATSNPEEGLKLRKEIGQLDHWTYEVVEDLFALKHIYTGLYFGFTIDLKTKPRLAGRRDRCQVFSFSVLRNGLITIDNAKGYHLSCNGGELRWTISITKYQQWRFIAVYNPSFYLSKTVRVANVAMPPWGTLLALAHAKGGYLGGNTGVGEALKVVPNLGQTEKFFFEKLNNTFALKQKVSANYVGYTATLGQQVGLANQKLTYETFSLNDEGNGFFTIVNDKQLLLSSSAGVVYWGNQRNEDAFWNFQQCSSCTMNSMPTIIRVKAPLDGQAYYIMNLAGQSIGGGNIQLDPLALVEELNQDGRWIFQQDNNGVFLRQASTGYFLGLNDELGKEVCLSPKSTEKERLYLHSQGEGAFQIRNVKNLTLTSFGSSLVWGNIDSSATVWTFQISNNDLNLHNMAQKTFGLRSARGGYIGGVRSGKLVLVDRLQGWEHFRVEHRGDRFALRQVVSGLYVGRGRVAGDKLWLVNNCDREEEFQLCPMGGNLFAIMNRKGYYITKKDEYDLELSTRADRWQFCPVHPDEDSSNTSKLTMRLMQHIFGEETPTYVKQFKSSLNFRSKLYQQQLFSSDLTSDRLLNRQLK